MTSDAKKKQAQESIKEAPSESEEEEKKADDKGPEKQAKEST